MIRFTSTELRPLLSQTGARQRPLTLEKNSGIYVRVPDDRHPGKWLTAWAVGCNPSTDLNGSLLAEKLIPDREFSFRTFMANSLFDAVLNEHHDLIMKPVISDLNNALTIHTETHPPLIKFVPVGEYRDQTQWLFDQSLRHFHACVSNAERLSWRTQALYVLDQVIRLDSKRAKPDDRKMFERAVRRLRDRISSLKPDGSVRYF
ncbi:hypothetical protein [Lonsdalea populi]|uniref:hypothetical protein n=1 Tax=Lonsdalea populi TaxID=1172565 RepID=UPI000A1E8539|nr:hypothetical protein [Lonsdalea populi]OSN01289.1 hypothetical protein AU499_07185 [Lonsdalea populi]QPQ24982.1 hypothetical protein I6N93_04050 [Lonsdalea populi]RAT43952.1 hypothetical protein AU494_08035 [Lonsdalea populi]RAT45107.1 hypothetical protein AU495_06270 [Lonsdalea populi]RAT57529.1 hypothetical protein AU500_05850 [Lonsdalea populi]